MPELIERDAKLFEAGSYPDKGLDVTEADLDAIIAGTAEVPIKVEHTATPFDGALGTLRGLYRKGAELFGKLAFTPPAWALVEAADARKLSVSVRKDKTGLAEVSLVREPRIADAAVFNGVECALFTADVPLADTPPDHLAFARGVLALLANTPDPHREVTHMPEKDQATFTKDDVAAMIAKATADAKDEVRGEFSKTLEAKDSEIARLTAKDRARDAQTTIDGLKRDGKLVPAAEPFAKALLLADKGDVVEFSGENLTITALFGKLMDAQPKAVTFGEQGKAGDEDEVTFSADEIELTMKVRGCTRDEAVEALKKYSDK